MGKYLDGTGLSHFMSKVKTWVNGAFLKLSGGTMTGTLTLVNDRYEDDNATAALNLRNSNVIGVNAIYTNDVSENAQEGIHFFADSTHVDSIHAKGGILYFTPYRQLGTSGASGTVAVGLPYKNGTGDYPFRTNIDSIRANKLAFLPADQVIIEKTTDGGQTWVDAGYNDTTKTGLFSGTRHWVYLPLLNGVKSPLCGLRITITAMKYDVPEGTAETDKYQYWSSEHVVSTERYCSIDEIYIWDTTNSDRMSVKVEAATGANPSSWSPRFNPGASFSLTGWSGSNHFKLPGNVFGGGTGQTGNYWNYRFTFFTIGPNNDSTLAPTYTTAQQAIGEIRAYGENTWTPPANNNLAYRDHLYTWDVDKSAIFPSHVYPQGNNNQNLGGGSHRWASVYATNINTSGYVFTNKIRAQGGADTYYHAIDLSTSPDRMEFHEYGGLWQFYRNIAGTKTGGTLVGYIDLNGWNGNVKGNVTGTATGIEQYSRNTVANYLINSLTTGSSDPVDADYYVSQYASGGSTTTTFHRRPMSALWNYIKGKISSVLGLTVSQYGGNAATATSAANVTGTVAIVNGGTGATTAAAAWTALGGGAIGKKDSLAASDIPNLAASKINSGTFDAARIPSHASTAATYGAASMSNYGHVKLSSATDSSSEALAATPMAVKAAYDLATTANTNAGNAMSAATGAYVLNVTYAISNGTVTCSAHVYSAGSEVTSTFADSCFTWSYNTGSGWIATSTHAKTYTPSLLSAFGGSVKCDFTPPSS